MVKKGKSQEAEGTKILEDLTPVELKDFNSGGFYKNGNLSDIVRRLQDQQG